MFYRDFEIDCVKQLTRTVLIRAADGDDENRNDRHLRNEGMNTEIRWHIANLWGGGMTFIGSDIRWTRFFFN